MDCSPRRVVHQRERDYPFSRVDVATEDLSVSADYPGLNKILPHVAPVHRKNFQHPVMIRQGAKWRSIDPSRKDRDSDLDNFRARYYASTGLVTV